MSDFDFCAAWPDDLKEVSRECYRLYCRVRNLEANIERVPPRDFDAVMGDLEQAREKLYVSSLAFQEKKRTWNLQSGR